MREIPDSVARAIEAARVPPLPQALLRLLHVIDDDDASTAELAEAVGLDAGLSARVLTAANSPALRRGNALHSIDKCLIALGTRLVRSIATCLAVQSVFERRNGKSPVDLSGFWSHSLHVAEIARAIAAATHFEHPDEAYLAGLLHDVGELVLLSALGDDYAEVLAQSGSEANLTAIETTSLGVHHGEIGTWLVDQWQTDLSIADGILFHHVEPDAIATAGRLPQIIWLAHALATERDPAERLEAFAETWFDQPVKNLDALRQNAADRTRQLSAAIGLPVPDPAGEPEQALPVVALSAASARQPTSAEDEIDAMVHDMALLQPLQRDLFGVESDSELLLSLRESARILFELSRTAFLFTHADGKRLTGAGFGDQPAVFRHALVRIDDQRSLAACAARSGHCHGSFDDDAEVTAGLLDVQFARALGSEGLLCVPMIGRRRSVGVMAFGLTRAQHARLRRRMPWLLNFGRIAAVSLEAWQDAREFRRKAEDDASARFVRQARRVVHEAGNPLGIIKSYLKILDGKLPEGVEVRQELGVLREEIDRVASIVHRMSEMPQGADPTAGFEAGELARELLSVYGAALFAARGIQVTTAIAASTETVQCDRDGVKQILLNLFKNASEALGNGGTLRIEVTEGVVQNGQRFVEIRIDDNGPGLPAAAIRSLTSPAEVKPEGKRGMGLSIVSEIATRIGVLLTCRNRPESGTSIALLLPCQRPAAR